MRRAIITICFIALLAFVCQKTKGAENKFFYSDGNIMPGEQWENVYVYNDGTTVNMSGGIVDGIGTFNASRLNIIDGWASTVDALDFSTINVTGGYVSGLHAYDNGTVIFADNAEAGLIRTFDSGKVIMTGGITGRLGAGYTSTIDIYGGEITDFISAGDTSSINIYGHDLIKVPTGGNYDYGRVYGYWQDWTPFNINLYGPGAYSHINLIPEPASLALLGLGFLVLRRKR